MKRINILDSLRGRLFRPSMNNPRYGLELQLRDDAERVV
jgi:hypothetical protein